jgi:hypothetical protein
MKVRALGLPRVALDSDPVWPVEIREHGNPEAGRGFLGEKSELSQFWISLILTVG